MSRDRLLVAALALLLLVMAGCSRANQSGSASNPAAAGNTSPAASAPETGPPSSPQAPATTVQVSPSSDVVAGMKGSGMMSTMAELCDQVGVSSTLATGGPYTILVPSNAAWTQLPAGMLEELRKPENRGKLNQLVSYHIIGGAVKFGTGTPPKSVTTVTGQTIEVTKQGSDVVIGGKAKVTHADVQAKNGLLDVIDTVLIPPGFKL